MNQNDPAGGKSPKKDYARAILIWFIVITGAVLFFTFIKEQSGFTEVTLTYSDFTTLIKSQSAHITNVRVLQKGLNRAELHGKVDDASILSQYTTDSHHGSSSAHFAVNLPFVDSQMLSQWDSLGIRYTFDSEKISLMDILMSSWPILLMIVFWIFILRQQQGGKSGVFGFGKSRAKLQNMENPKITFVDVAGVQEAKAELEEIIAFLRDPKKFKKLGGKIPKGVLLLGPPGTGKTLLAKAVAGEAGVPFFSMSGSDFVEMFVGVGASRVRDLFDNAKKSAPCIIFIDEIDAVGRQRGAGLGGGHDEREQTLNQMLVEMDGFEENSGVILIAATNRPDVLDPALLRPGRFDRQVVVDVPDVKGREAILKVHVKNVPLSADVDLSVIARGTPGFVGADLANLVNEAALMAARFEQEAVTMLDFEEAKDKVMMGAERKSMVLSDKERENTAYHEAGHAICSIHLDHADPLHKVTIIPRGRALGITFSLPGEDKHSYSREYMLDRICMSMGGRVAEDIVFGVRTTGASNDIKQATDMARKMICDYGMSEELGPISYGKKDDSIFLGREISSHRDYSDTTADTIDDLMRRIVLEQESRARGLLSEFRSELDTLAKALLEHEMLDASEVKRILSGEVIENAKKTRMTPALLAAKNGKEEEKKEKEEDKKSEDKKSEEGRG